MIEVQVTEVGHIQHGLEAFLTFCFADVVLTDHGGLKVEKKPTHVFVFGIAGRKDQFAWLPALEIVLESKKSVRSVMRARPRFPC